MSTNQHSKSLDRNNLGYIKKLYRDKSDVNQNFNIRQMFSMEMYNINYIVNKEKKRSNIGTGQLIHPLPKALRKYLVQISEIKVA